MGNIKGQLSSRVLVSGIARAVSPIMIGSGDDTNSDMDLMRDWDGNPFIPGTSVAGMARHWLEEQVNINKIQIDKLFGGKKDASAISPLVFYDLLPKSMNKPIIRDGVALDYETKTVNETAKYDYEVIEPGSSFTFKLEYQIRENDFEVAENKTLLYQLVNYWKKEGFRIGAKTRRGMGLIKLEDLRFKELNMKDKNDVETWMNWIWDKDKMDDNLSGIKQGVADFFYPMSVSVNFEIPYSVLLRSAPDEPSQPDHVQIKANEKPVIPGTAWNGTLRNAVYHQAKELGFERKIIETKILEEIFGFVREKTKEARASKVLIDESIIEGSHSLRVTRTKIDRFTGGVVETALFDEAPEYKGTVGLRIYFTSDEKWMAGAIILALYDLVNGFQAIGGATSVGRGILKANHSQINFLVNNEAIDHKVAFQAYKKYLDTIKEEKDAEAIA